MSNPALVFCASTMLLKNEIPILRDASHPELPGNVELNWFYKISQARELYMLLVLRGCMCPDGAENSGLHKLPVSFLYI